MNLIQNTICKFTRLADLVLDVGCGTTATGQSCWLFQQHRRFVGFERDQNYVGEEVSSRGEMYAGQLMNHDSDLTPPEDFSSSAKTLVHDLDRVATNKQSDVLAVPKELAALQTFPKHTLHFMWM